MFMYMVDKLKGLIWTAIDFNVYHEQIFNSILGQKKKISRQISTTLISPHERIPREPIRGNISNIIFKLNTFFGRKKKQWEKKKRLESFGRHVPRKSQLESLAF